MRCVYFLVVKSVIEGARQVGKTWLMYINMLWARGFHKRIFSIFFISHPCMEVLIQNFEEKHILGVYNFEESYKMGVYGIEEKHIS